MDSTVKLGLDYIVAGQAQKEVSHNEALRDLDGLCHLAFVSRGENVPPVTPVDGGAYAVGSAPSGDWSGQAGKVALYNDGWKFKTPCAGWRAYAVSEKKLFLYDGAAWVFLAAAVLEGSFSWTPGTLANGVGVSSSVVSVSGARLGDFVRVAAPYSLQGVSAFGFVSADNAVVVRIHNATGASVTLGGGTWKVRVETGA